MSRMSANIATMRRHLDGRHKNPGFPPPERYEQARQPNGSVCPTCLRFGPADCKEHSPKGDEAK